MSELFVVDGICAGTVFTLPDVPTVLGRSAECHVQIGDPWISSMHAMFERRGDDLWVVDLDSRNGTFVDEARVRESRIAPGSRLRFGKTSAEMHSSAERKDLPEAVREQGGAVRYVSEMRGELAAPPHEPDAEARGTVAAARPSGSRSLRRQLAVVNEIAKVLVEALGLDDALARIVRAAGAAVRADRAALLLADDRGEMLLRAHEPADADPRVSKTIVAAAARSRAGILTLDARQDVRFSESDSVIAQGIRSCICAPVWDEDRILGMLILDRGLAEPFTAEDLDVAAAVGHQAALAVERARFLERQRDAEERRRLLDGRFPPEMVGRLASDGAAREPPPIAPREEAALLVAELEGFAEAAGCGSDLASPLAQALDALRAAAFEHGGVVMRRGAGLAALFGILAPDPDAVHRALRAALAMRERISALPRLPGGTPVRFRAGVEVGRIMAGAVEAGGELDVVALGAPAEIAARLALAATGGAIRVGLAAALRAGTAFALRDVDADAFELVGAP